MPCWLGDTPRTPPTTNRKEKTMPTTEIPEHIKAAQADFEKENPKKERKEKEKRIRVNINLFLNEYENEQLETKAKMAGMKKASTAREMIFLNTKNYGDFKKIQTDFYKFLGELSAQGNNLNQMARKLNFNGYPTAHVENAIATVCDLYNEILILLNSRIKK